MQKVDYRQHVKAWTEFTCKCNQKTRSVILHTLGRGSSGMEYFHIAAGRFPTGMACLLRIWSIHSLMYCSVAAVCLKQHPLISTPSFACEYRNIVRWYHVMSLYCHVIWWLPMLGVKGHSMAENMQTSTRWHQTFQLWSARPQGFVGESQERRSEDLPHLQSCHTPWVCSKLWQLGGWQSDFHCETGGGRKVDLTRIKSQR